MARTHYKRIDWTEIAFIKDFDAGIKDGLLEAFRNGYIKTEKLVSPDDYPRFAIKITKGVRAICTTIKIDGKDCLVVLESTSENHKIDQASSMQKGGVQSLIESLSVEELDVQISAGVTAEGKFLFYSQEQQKAVQYENPKKTVDGGIKYHIVNGLAGFGKTTIGYDVLAKASEVKGQHTIYISKSKNLVNQASKELGGQTKSITYEDFVFGYLHNNFREFLTHFLGMKDRDKDKFIKEVKLKNEQELLKKSWKFAKNGLNNTPQNDLEEAFKTIIDSFLQNKIEFAKWIRGNKNVKAAELIKALGDLGKEPDALYEEIQKACIGLGKKSSIYPDIHHKDGEPSLVENILKAYVDHLNSHHLVDLSLVSAQFPDAQYGEPQRKVVVIDEAQNFSPLELQTLLSLVRMGGATIYLCRDGNQSLADPYNLTLQSMRQFTGKDQECTHDLSVSYRSPPAITKVANLLLKIKEQVIGGSLDKPEASAGAGLVAAKAEFLSNTEHGGYLRHITDSSDKDIEGLIQDSHNIVECVIIAFSEEDRARAGHDFPNAMILLPEEALGLEYKKVILFHPFGENSLLKDGNVFNEYYDSSKPSFSKRAANFDNFKYVIPFNRLFVAITRSTSDLYIWDIDDRTKGSDFFTKAFAGIYLGYDEKMATKIDEMKANLLMKFIEENQYSMDSVLLAKYVKQAYIKFLEERNFSDEFKTGLESLVRVLDIAHLKNGDLRANINEGLQKIKDEAVSRADADSVHEDASSAPKLEPSPPSSGAASPVEKKQKPAKQKKKTEKNSPSKEAKGPKKNPTDPDTAEVAPKAPDKAAEDDKRVDVTLRVAVERNECAKVQDILSKHPGKANLTDNKGRELLYNAVCQGYAEIVELLLEKKANPNIAAPHGITPLYIACSQGHTKIVKLLLENGAKPNKAPDNKLTPLFAACHEGHTEIVKLLLAKKADPNKAPDSKLTPLYHALDKGHTDIVQLLLEHNADQNIAPDKDLTPLVIACNKGHHDVVKLLLDKNANPNIAWNNGLTPLYNAVHNGHTDIAQLLLEHNADPNIPDSRGFAPLFIACARAQSEVVKLLLDNNADPDITNNKGKTVLYAASAEGHIKVVELLLENRADKDKTDESGMTPLFIASAKGHHDVVKLLLENRADKDKTDESGMTPLYAASYSGHTDIVKLLLDNNADLHIPDNSGMTPLYIASSTGHHDVVKLLLAHNAGLHIHIADSTGKTPLYYAFDKGHTDIVQLLLAHNAGLHIHIADNTGKTPLYHAVDNGHTDIVQLLLEKKADPNIAGPEGVVPLYRASFKGYTQIVKLLLAYKADQNIAHDKGLTPFVIACHEGHHDVVKLLLENGADKDKIDKGGMTPLCAASSQGHSDVVKLLLKNGADKEIADSRGFTPLYNAVDNRHTNIVKLLLEHNAHLHIDIADNTGKTPLYNAVDNGHTDIVKLLLASGANLNINNDVFTLMELAHQKGHHTVTNILLPYVARTFSPQTTTQEEVSPGALVEKDYVEIAGGIAGDIDGGEFPG